MSRNGTGTYVLPITFVPGTPAKAEDVNSDLNDIGTEITNSLPRDGQAGMTGVAKFVDGTVGVPGISWNSDPSTGIRRAGSGAMSMVCTGVDTLGVSSAGITFLGGYSDPAGRICMWAGSNAPTGWLLCNGAAVSQTTYPALYVVCGTTWNTGGEGAGNFRLPNATGRTPVGVDAGGSVMTVFTATLGATGGAQTITLDATMIPSHLHSVSITSGSESASHYHAGGSHTHTYSGTSATESQGHTHTIPNHTHTGTTDACGALSHTHGYNSSGNNNTGAGGGGAANSGVTAHTASDGPNVSLAHTHTFTTDNSGGGGATSDISQTHTHTYSGTTDAGGVVATGTESAGHTHLVSGNTGNTGGGLAHNNVQPSFAVNFIIRAY